MVGIRVAITRYVSDEQPGFVECEFTDTHGQLHRFIEKVPVVTSIPINATSTYPQAGVVACRIVEKDFNSITVDTLDPWQVESVDGISRFEIKNAQLGNW